MVLIREDQDGKLLGCGVPVEALFWGSERGTRAFEGGTILICIDYI